MKYGNIRKYIDATLLKVNSKCFDYQSFIEKVLKANFRGVCIPGSYVEYAVKLKEELNSSTKVVSVVGFPFGYESIQEKVSQIKYLKSVGVDDVDVVCNISMLVSERYDYIVNEVETLRNIAEGIVLKVIIETCYLNEDQKIKVLEILKKSNVDYIKTSTGFGVSGANIEDVKLFKSISENNIKIKASGGIRGYDKVVEFLKAGADIIGMSKIDEFV